MIKVGKSAEKFLCLVLTPRLSDSALSELNYAAVVHDKHVFEVLIC
jgi:hypothetical protein